MLSGKYQQFLHFLKEIPGDIVSPQILVYQAAAMLFSEYPRNTILNLLDQIEKSAEKDLFQVETTLIKALLESFNGHPEKGIYISQKILKQYDKLNTFFRNIVERNLGVAYTIKNDLFHANLWFERHLSSSYHLQDWPGVLASYNYLTFIRKVQGRLFEANVIYLKALDFIEEHHLEKMPHAIKILSGYGSLLLKWNKIEKAKTTFKKAISLAKETDILYACSAFQNLSITFALENDFRNALSVIQELRQFSQRSKDLYHDIHAQQTYAIEALIHTWAGRNEQAYRWVVSKGFDKISENASSAMGFQLVSILPITAQILLAKGEFEKVIDLLEPIIPKYIHQGANAYLIRGLNILAIAYDQIDNIEKSNNALLKAIKLAEPENNLGDFLISGSQMIPLLFKAFSSGISKDFIKRLLTIFSDKVNHHLVTTKTDSEHIDTLTQREMEVLELIAQGMTNQEIANALFLSKNTIKSHSIKIYRKLNVNNRHQAISKAKLLGILRENGHHPPRLNSLSSP